MKGEFEGSAPTKLIMSHSVKRHHNPVSTPTRRPNYDTISMESILQRQYDNEILESVKAPVAQISPELLTRREDYQPTQYFPDYQPIQYFPLKIKESEFRAREVR